jgi:hypothetical protein
MVLSSIAHAIRPLLGNLIEGSGRLSDNELPISTVKLFLFALLLVLTVAPAQAKVLAEGKVRGGLYWQKIEQKSGRVVYQCRSTTEAKFQKAAACEKAGAVKP